MYTLVWTTGFTRTAGKFLKQHQELKEKFAEILGDLERDPFQPHLKVLLASRQAKGRASSQYHFKLSSYPNPTVFG